MTDLIRRYMTSFVCAIDGENYAGPLILADCPETAEAIRQTSLLGPNGETLVILGELVQQFPVDDGHGRADVLRRRD